MTATVYIVTTKPKNASADLKPPVNEGAELFNVRVIEGYADVPMDYSIRFTLAYGTGRPDYVSRMYLVEAGERIHDVISEVERRVPALGRPN